MGNILVNVLFINPAVYLTSELSDSMKKWCFPDERMNGIFV